MKSILLSLTCLLLSLGASARADELPYFSSLRAEILSQLTTLSNAVPFDKKLNSKLIPNLKLIDKTKPTFITGASALGTLAKALGKTSLSNAFLPIVVDTRDAYLDAIALDRSELEVRLADTIPGKVQAAAEMAIDKLAIALEAAETNSNLTLSLKSLSAAAKALAAAEKAVAKAEVAKPGPSFITATITESAQGTTVLKPLKGTLEAYYDDFAGTIEIDVGELTKLTGGRVQTRMLEITATVPGEGTHELSLTQEASAVYQRIVSPNLAEFEKEEPNFEFYENYFTVDLLNRTLGSGSLTITVQLDELDPSKGIVWGDFTFTAPGSENPELTLEATVTGSFLVRFEPYSSE